MEVKYFGQEEEGDDVEVLRFVTDFIITKRRIVANIPSAVFNVDAIVDV